MKKFFNEIDPGIFLPPAIIVVIITVLAIAIPVQFSAAMGAALTWILDELGWFMGLVVLMMFFICCFAMFSKYGKIKLGGASSKPLMSTGSWIALSFTSAMAIGISFWGTAEPMMHFATPAAMDGVEAYSIGAAQASMNWTFHHWGPVFFAMYCGAGVMVAFATQNMKLPYRCSSAIYPLIGDKIYGMPGKIFEAIITISIVCSIASSLGMGALQISAGLDYAFGIPNSVTVAAVVILVMAVLYVGVSLTPISGGMKKVGNFNMLLYIFLLVFVLVFGPTRFLIESFVASVGSYLQNLPTLATNWDAFDQDGFMKTWTAFFWPWWLCACPPTGLFLAKLSQGRTLRQFVMVNLVFPALFCWIWMTVFGGTGMYFDIFENAGIGAAIIANGKDAATYELMKALPAASFTIIVTLVCAAISFNTKASAVSVTLAASTGKNDGSVSKISIAFWGISMALITAVLLLAGGKASLANTQTVSVLLGLPVSILLVLMGIGFFKQMFHCKKYDKVGTFDDPRYENIVTDQLVGKGV